MNLLKTSLLLLFLSPICQSFSQVSEEQVIRKTDSLLQDVYNKGIFSGNVLISRQGKEIYFKSLGYADWGSKKEFTKSTVFNIGSLNKQFTQEMIRQLVNEKKLNYSDLLSSHLESFKGNSKEKVTIQHLLDMESGFGDYLQNIKFRDLENKNFSLAELLALIQKEELQFEPGTNRQYSNSGYAILGALIEKVTGISYETNLFTRIQQPLGLTKLLYTKQEKEKESNRSTGTEITVSGNKISKDDLQNSTPAGGIYTNCIDLLKFTEAKFTQKLPSKFNYKSGSVAGGTPIWNSVISYSNDGYAIVIMANTGDIADKIIICMNSILKGENYKPVALPIVMQLNEIIKEKGVPFLKEKAPALAQQEGLPFDERFLNFFGYQFINSKELESGLALFKANTELFPNSSNAFDSLGEAYLLLGDKKNALLNYKIAVKLDPQNQNAKQQCSLLE
jgi:CubicO group peptidase (beta-lactamase class C family)